jgi:ADP-ribose pyrophosphatase
LSNCERTLESKTLYEGRVVTLQHNRVQLPDGSETTREIVRHRGAVAIVALTEADKVWLVRQYRYGPDRHLLELPAGKLEPGEQPRATAERELLEEVGLRARQWERLTSFYTSPGFCDEHLTVYLAQELKEVPEEERPEVEGEFIETECWPLDRTVEAVLDEQIQDAKTAAGVLAVALHRGLALELGQS